MHLSYSRMHSKRIVYTIRYIVYIVYTIVYTVYTVLCAVYDIHYIVYTIYVCLIYCTSFEIYTYALPLLKEKFHKILNIRVHHALSKSSMRASLRGSCTCVHLCVVSILLLLPNLFSVDSFPADS